MSTETRLDRPVEKRHPNRLACFLFDSESTCRKVEVMLHNQSEVKEFDEKIFTLRGILDSANEQQRVSAIGDVMRILVSHDWPEWAPGHQWHVHASCFEVFDTDDLEYLKRFVAGAVTVLKSGGILGVLLLQKYSAAYLQQRGYEVSVSRAELDSKDPWQGWKTSKQYAVDLDIHTKKIQRALPGLIEKKQADRQSQRGKINLRQSACEILKPQS